MKVFISWSGEVSEKIAGVFHEWLPSVMQHVQPYMSAEDIEKGKRWSVDIASELETTSFGLICLTPENIKAPWIMFEAGALSKSMSGSKVVPILFDLKPSDVHGPLLQFQAAHYRKDDIKKLMGSVNSASGDKALADVKLDKSFEKWWPDIETKIDEILKTAKSKKPAPKNVATNEDQKEYLSEVLEEILELSRANSKELRALNEDAMRIRSDGPIARNSLKRLARNSDTGKFEVIVPGSGLSKLLGRELGERLPEKLYIKAMSAPAADGLKMIKDYTELLDRNYDESDAAELVIADYENNDEK